jgi:ribosomal protein S1
MSEELNFEQMLNDFEGKDVRNGAVIEGSVIDVKPDVAYLNIGGKSDGILTKEEYSNENVDLTTKLAPGDKLEVKVLKMNDGDGQTVLSYKRLAQERGNKRIEEAFNNGEVLKAKVTQVLNGGLTVLVEDTRVFIPASLVSDVYEKDLGKYADQEIEFRISEFNPRRRRIIGDRRHLIAERKAEAAKELFSRIQVGDVVEGTVKNVTDFGAFVDLGGADGLLHISEMSWGRVENPHKNFHNGDQLQVLIKDIRDQKIALSLKFPDENPWNEASERFAVGAIVQGKVARMTDFGAFIELLPGVDALLHVSQISRNHVDKPSDVLKIGEEIEAKVVDFDADNHKISLSMKALESAPQEDNAVPVYQDKAEDAPTIDIPQEVAEEATEE